MLYSASYYASASKPHAATPVLFYKVPGYAKVVLTNRGSQEKDVWNESTISLDREPSPSLGYPKGRI